MTKPNPIDALYHRVVRRRPVRHSPSGYSASDRRRPSYPRYEFGDGLILRWVLNVGFGLVVAIIVVAVVVAIGFGIYLRVTAPTKGTIHGRGYTAPYTSESCTTVNKQTSCVPVYHGADYEFDLYDGKNHGWRSVSPADYARYHVGDYFPG